MSSGPRGVGRSCSTPTRSSRTSLRSSVADGAEGSRTFAWRTFSPEPGAGPGAFLAVPALERRGIRAAFTTRHGGRSSEPFSSLNLSYSSGDDPSIVRANRTRALAAIGGELGSWTGARQVHGAGAVRVTGAQRGAGWDSPANVVPDADALWTGEGDVSLVVLTGDCTPILLADPSTPRIGVVHAGWRGLLAGVVEGTVGAMGGPDGMAAFLGPAIGPCCYEVGEEVAVAASERLGDAVVRRTAAGPRLNLWAGALRALERAGIRDVWPAALCTRCEPGRFYSHRAGARGRQGLVARIVPRTAA